jgi:hypothetical protein
VAPAAIKAAAGKGRGHKRVLGMINIDADTVQTQPTRLKNSANTLSSFMTPRRLRQVQPPTITALLTSFANNISARVRSVRYTGIVLFLSLSSGLKLVGPLCR